MSVLRRSWQTGVICPGELLTAVVYEDDMCTLSLSKDYGDDRLTVTAPLANVLEAVAIIYQKLMAVAGSSR